MKRLIPILAILAFVAGCSLFKDDRPLALCAAQSETCNKVRKDADTAVYAGVSAAVETQAKALSSQILANEHKCKTVADAGDASAAEIVVADLKDQCDRLQVLIEPGAAPVGKGGK